MNKNNNPLVSICIPVFNGEKDLFRAIESCISQTYKNIEIIISDDGSRDKTREIAENYAIKDKRIEYIRSGKVGIVQNFSNSFNAASGEFIQLLNHDDWLSKNYVDEGIKSFNQFPQAAAIIPNSIFVREKQENGSEFEFDSQVSFKTGVNRTEYLVRNFYKKDIGAIFTLSFMRRNALLEAMSYLNKIITGNSNDVVSEETKKYLKIGWGIDIIVPMLILTKHDFAVATDESAYIKTVQIASLGKLIKFNLKTAAGTIGYIDYTLNCLLYVYRQYWLKYLTGMKIFVGAQAINSIIFSLFKNKFKLNYWFGILEPLKKNFQSYSRFEKICVFAIFAPILIIRFIKAVRRKFIPQKYPEKLVFRPINFLDRKRRFIALLND